MPIEVDGRLIWKMTNQLDQSMENEGERAIVRLKNRSQKKALLTAPEEFILNMAEKDLEELY